jgi:hypothetical protein
LDLWVFERSIGMVRKWVSSRNVSPIYFKIVCGFAQHAGGVAGVMIFVAALIVMIFAHILKYIQ